jgi:hypothetical protein
MEKRLSRLLQKPINIEVLMSTYKEVWENLRTVDCSSNIQKKNGLSYLSWTWAWSAIMEEYPEATYHFPDSEIHGDGTVTVHCTINIGELERTMWLPVMSGFKNAAVSNPSARDIGDSKMRCLVKCMAMFGLGHYIYAGEDLPPDSKGDSDKTEKVVDKAVQQVQDVKPETLEEAVEEAMKGSMTEADAVAYVELAISFAKQTDTVEGLKSLHTENKKTLEEMKLSQPDIYKDYVAKFKARRAEVQSQ